MTREEVEDFVREGDIVTVKATVLGVMAGGLVKTAQVHLPNDIVAHERRFLRGDKVRARFTTDKHIWTVMHVEGPTAWIQRPHGTEDIASTFAETSDLVHAFPETVVDKNPPA